MFKRQENILHNFLSARVFFLICK